MADVYFSILLLMFTCHKEERTSLMRIMLVEDEALTVMAMKMKLQQQGYTDIHTFASGEAALAEVEALQPDIVFMDIMLAGKLDGIETTVRLKEVHDCPVIYTTGYNDKETKQRALESGAAAYLQKPISVSVLLNAIAIEKSNARTGVSTSPTSNADLSETAE